VNEFDSILRPAMTTKNTILTSIVDSVLFIPIDAIFSTDSVSFVYKKDGRSIVRQQVIVGLSNDNEIIIRSGLSENDEVLLVPPENSDKTSLDLLPKDTIKKYISKPLPVKIQGQNKTDSLKSPEGKKQPVTGPPERIKRSPAKP
jgi:hypothetical protein